MNIKMQLQTTFLFILFFPNITWTLRNLKFHRKDDENFSNTTRFSENDSYNPTINSSNKTNRRRYSERISLERDVRSFVKQHSFINSSYQKYNEGSTSDHNYAKNQAVDDKLTGKHDMDLPVESYHKHTYAYNRRQIPDKLMHTKEIHIKQGRLKGIVRNMHPQSSLQDVDQFLGLPYAEAPVGNNRFMPPGAPPPWPGLKIAAHLPPVCPQNLPDLSKMRMKLSKGRYEQLAKLLPYLKNENEDCLYLNLYVPRWDNKSSVPKFPVIVYIHGESYEWNSGNPYDGSVLSSYGQVILVTLNYRLGILGFMKPGISEHTVSNFGLLDQIAALQWVKDNIETFGGDSHSVTLMGHGTGAACVNFLMVSPVAKGLFHRAILMSGSAMSDWATANYSLHLTMQIVHGLNCPLDDTNDQMLNCLRKKRYQELLKVPTSTPEFSTSFGPLIDGLVIPNQPYKVMGQYTDLFSRYDLLFGVTEVESYHTLNSLVLEQGLRESERDSLLRLYMQNRFEIRPDLALATTLKKYTDIYNNPLKASSHEHRDAILDILSDARVSAPLIQTGIYHAKVNPRNYMYVFGHNSEAGPYANLPHSVVGEELAFVFGAPLAPVGPFPLRYSIKERLLSEAVMVYWTNFAKTGNPKAPWHERFINLHPLEWKQYDIDWSEFNGKTQSYINIGIPPSIEYKYRNVFMNFWNKELPDELNQIKTIQNLSYYNSPFTPSTTYNPYGENNIITGHINKYPSEKIDQTEDPLRTLKILLEDKLDYPDTDYNSQTKFVGTITELDKTTNHVNHKNMPEIIKSESTIHILISVVIIFITINIFILVAYLIKRKKSRNVAGKKICIMNHDRTPDDEVKRSKNKNGEDNNVLGMMHKQNSFDFFKSDQSPINGFKIKKKFSSGTVDPHTKVSNWISHEVGRESPKISKKDSQLYLTKKNCIYNQPEKISVAIDATPQARGNSILCQEPIEITKMKSQENSDKNIIICHEVEIDEQLISPDITENNYVSTNSIGNTDTSLKIDHRYSRSDPVEIYYTVHKNTEQTTSFIESPDMNVTSRNENIKRNPLTPSQQLQIIQKRNFPKVLPTHNNDHYPINRQFKRRSLPPQHYTANLNQITKIPPTPPPRTISTLGRYPSNRRQSNALTTSPLMLAESSPEDDEEPTIAHNTLIVGPLVPKSQESLYSTINRRKNSDSLLNFDKHSSQLSIDEQKPKQTFSKKLNSIENSTNRLEAIKSNSDNNFHTPLGCSLTVTQPKETISAISERDTITPDSSASSDTGSSTGTVKTELKPSKT